MIIAIDGPVPTTVLRSYPGLDTPATPKELAHWVNTHVEIPNFEQPPFLIVFGDVTMHPTVPKNVVAHYLGDKVRRDVDALQAWLRVAKTWNTWFLRRPTGKALRQACRSSERRSPVPWRWWRLPGGTIAVKCHSSI